MNDILATILKTLAPTVATALLGPLGGVAVAAIGKIIGVSDASVASVTQAFQDGKISPDQISEIKKLEMQYQAEESERDFKYVDLVFKDVKSARDMQIATNSTVPAYLTFFVTAGFFGILAWMMIDTSVKDSPPLLIMLGQLSAGFAAVLSFWFGTTKGSQQKDALIANSTPVK